MVSEEEIALQSAIDIWARGPAITETEFDGNTTSLKELMQCTSMQRRQAKRL
jgi:hypothetical protein